jgi:membrane associated rhomboid family serine protease
VIIPYGTDAPIYHRPIATVSLIVVNTVAFFATWSMAQDDRMAYALVRGDGLHPLQWLTSIFMHGGIEHLVGNMIFLWAFGLVVEGKLGALKFLVLYLGIGLTHSAAMQVLSLGSEHGYILGASAVIYGLMGVCMIWAPANCITCFYFFWIIRIFTGTGDIAILIFALFYIGWEFVAVLLEHGAVSTPLLHLTGAVIGIAVGLVMLQAKLVDCENWDLFAVMSGHEGRPADKRRKRQPRARPAAQVAGAVAAAPAATQARRPASSGGGRTQAGVPADVATDRLRRFLDAGDALGAHSAADRAMRTVAGWVPDNRDWQRLMKGLLDINETRLAVTTMEDYLRRVVAPSPRVRLKLAQLLLHDYQRPAHALRVLQGFGDEVLPGDLEVFRSKLAAEAQHQCDEGALELDGDAW